MPGTSSLSSVFSIHCALWESGTWPPANTLSEDLGAFCGSCDSGSILRLYRTRKESWMGKGAAGSAVQTLMTKQESGKTSLARVVPLNRRPIWKRLVDKSPRPPRSWTGTWSGGRAIPESCGPNTPTCQQRFGWKWRWRLSISSACLWLLLYWWFIMFFSGHRIHITTSPAQRYPTAPSAHPGLDETHRH